MTFPGKEKKTMVSHVEIFNISASVKRHGVLATQLRNLNGIQFQMNSYTFLKKKTNNNYKKKLLSCDVSIKKRKLYLTSLRQIFVISYTRNCIYCFGFSDLKSTDH